MKHSASLYCAILLSFVAASRLQAQMTYPPTLVNELGGQSISATTTKCVILIHGWNPDGNVNCYGGLEWSGLLNNVKARLNGSGWGVVAYDWHEDAATGGIFGLLFTDFFNYGRASAAAYNAGAHGFHLAIQLNELAPNLREVHFIAHSAGSWAARKAMEQLLALNPYVVVQVTLLDPFVPSPGDAGDYSDVAMGNAKSVTGNARIQRLENYYANDSLIDGWNAYPFGSYTGPTYYTQENFVWRDGIDITQRVDWGAVLVNPPGPNSVTYFANYDWHSGPIQFYSDCISASLFPASIPSGLQGAGCPFDFQQIGWKRSLYAWESLLPQITAQPANQSAQTGGSATFNVTANQTASYEWYKVGGSYVGSGSTLTLNSVSSGSAGDYVVRVSNSYGQLYSRKATLTVGPAPAPTIFDVSPSTLTGLPSPQTQRIQIIGSGFTSSSTLTFNDGNQSWHSVPARLTLVNANELDYLIAVGVNAATWTVKVINGSQESNFGNFSVVSPASAINISCSVSPSSGSPGFPLTVSGNATYNNNGGAVPVGTVTITVGGQNYTAAINNGSYSRSIYAPSTPGNYTVSVFVTDGIGRTGSTSSTLTVTPNGSTSGYTINGYLTCKSADTADPWMYHDAIDAFGSDDSWFYVWWEMTDITDAHTLYLKLYRPDGTLYSQTDTTTFGQNGSHYDWWRGWWYWQISGYDIADLEGRWTVKLYVDGSYKRTISFTLRYEFKEHRLCKDHQASDPYDPINPTSIFTQTDAKAETWCKLDKVSNPLEMKWQWYEPNGSQYSVSTYNSTDPNSQGRDYYDWYKFWGNISIQGNSAANKCGDWHVDVFIKGAFGNWDKKYTDYFRILEAPLQPPTCAASATPANPTAGQTITLNVSATDNTYLKNVVVHWKDASEHTNPWNNLFASSLNQNLSIGSFAAGQQIEYWVVASDTSGNLTESIHETVTVTLQYTINASAGAGGTIGPSGNITKNASENQTFTASPDANYVVNQWQVDGSVVQTGGNDYTLSNIQANKTVQVTFKDEPTRIISLSGDLAFGGVTVGTSAQRTLTIANNGNSTLTVSGISYPSGFSGNWSGTISQGNSQKVNVTFSPVSAISYGGNNLVVNSGATSGTGSMAVSGIGVNLPSLSISRQGGDLVFTWPADVPGFTLEYTTNLPATSWTSNSVLPALVGGNYIVTNPITGENKFYRLKN